MTAVRQTVPRTAQANDPAQAEPANIRHFPREGEAGRGRMS